VSFAVKSRWDVVEQAAGGATTAMRYIELVV